MDVKKLYDDYEAYIIEMRRWFHRHPELSLKEQNTSRKIQEELQGMGIPFEVLAPNCGVAATIKGGKEGKTIALRADIDALPVKEETGLEFTSENEGVMHACGHDASREASRIPPEAIYPALVNLCTGNKPGSATCPLPELALSLCRALRQSLGRNGRINKERPSC